MTTKKRLILAIFAIILSATFALESNAQLCRRNKCNSGQRCGILQRIKAKCQARRCPQPVDCLGAWEQCAQNCENTSGSSSDTYGQCMARCDARYTVCIDPSTWHQCGNPNCPNAPLFPGSGATTGFPGTDPTCSDEEIACLASCNCIGCSNYCTCVYKRCTGEGSGPCIYPCPDDIIDL